MAEQPTREQAIEAWRTPADELTWITPYRTLFAEAPPYHHWFVGGELNLAANATDRHLADRADRTAVLWEGEPGDRRQLTYGELHEQVLRMAAGLRRLGMAKGDRIALHLGWLPETVVTLLAAFRLGAVVTVIPVALPVETLSARLADFGPRILVTQDGGWRRGAILPLKARADAAIEATHGIEHTIVIRRTGVHVEWFEGDRWYDDVLTDGEVPDVPAVPLPADHPAYSVYLANRGGEPVAIRLGSANIAVVSVANLREVMAPYEDDVFWCAAEVSWMGGQLHGILGPLLNGSPAVMYEGTLDVPNPARAWQIVERYGVTAIATSPSVVAALRGWSLEAGHDIATLRRVVTIGERLDPALREWLREILGEKVVLADGWGQLELGGIVTYDLEEPPSGLPRPGFALLDQDGRPVADGEAGEWVVLHPWAGTMRAVESGEDPTAYHWTRYPGRYATGDKARRRPDGSIEFLGRYDEVISISGQLVSLTEVQQALLDHPFVAAAEAFENIDAGFGRSVGAAIVLRDGAPDDAATLHEMQDSVRELLGGLSRPRVLIVLDRIDADQVGAATRQALAKIAAGAGGEPVRARWDAVLAATMPGV
ncbi:MULTISPECIES: AMP-binding protein [Nocardioides]|uniref:AMP-binding protein n=1 Tax=Nocardioides vastitatis TaxID=2568655 RepID=A0ABW0ZIB3_9ACTN|nr:AMP-binding protein [Nocardioides sp.]THJ04485.1 acetate--CoA ligase [Nocardioides sp.]